MKSRYAKNTARSQRPGRSIGLRLNEAERPIRLEDETVSDHPRIESIDEPAIRAFRAKRIRQELRRQDHEAVLVVDPVNLRYATGTRNMQVWTMHNIVRYALVFAHGPGGVVRVRWCCSILRPAAI